MKNTFVCLSMFFLFPFTGANAQTKTICAVTFNSADEKQVFSKNLGPHGYQTVELVPANNNPNWLLSACRSNIKCDILLFSGHFGGVFFGEGNSSTLSINELLSLREEKSCDNILNATSVYLMGCNTLASKTKDHRTVDTYVRTLITNGFPRNLAENTAASRYLNFGQSIGETMGHIFSQSKVIAGFDSTGPLGAQAAPLLQKAFNNSSVQDKLSVGIKPEALKNSFNGQTLRLIRPEKISIDEKLQKALSINTQTAEDGWRTILLSQQSIRKYHGDLLRHRRNQFLANIIQSDAVIRENIRLVFNDVMRVAQGLPSIQLESLNFLRKFNILGRDQHLTSVSRILDSLVAKPIDYVSADQICSILKEQKELNPSSQAKAAIEASPYSEYLAKCAGVVPKVKMTYPMSCLRGDVTYRHDWACLTDNQANLDIPSCQLAKSRNRDPENADDMLWYCYSKMRSFNQLTKSQCLELTQSFSILGNQLKMNWNCQNRIR